MTTSYSRLRPVSASQSAALTEDLGERDRILRALRQQDGLDALFELAHEPVGAALQQRPLTLTRDVEQLSDIPWGTPRYWPFVAAFVLLAGVTGSITSSKAGFLGWELTIAWSWPVINSVIGLCGIRMSRQFLRAFWSSPPPERQHGLLIVTVVTIGRRDVLPALRRSLTSHAASFPAWFSQLRIDVVVDEGCEAAAEIHDLAAAYVGLVRVVTVPATYRTPNGTRFKARAEHYANELHQRAGEARRDVWVLHMDDDTGSSPDTARAIAAFIQRQQRPGRKACHLAQGVLTYPRQLAPNWFTWLADSVRPSDDLSRFCAWTGSGTPRAGLHGELLLIRASIEAEIGWDFGPEAIVEDAWFAMTFAQHYPGRSAWLPGRCFGASPATVRDFIKQRERWARGLLHLCFSPRFPASSRLYLAYSLTTWIPGLMQNIVTVLILQALVLSIDGSPVAWPVIFVWSLNMAYYIWCYAEGHRVNAMVSETRTHWWNYVLVLLLLPVFSVVEGLSALLALFRFSSGRAPDFSVIAKPS